MISPFSDEILQGTATLPPNLDPNTNRLLQALASPPEVPPPTPWTFTLAKHISGWRKARESTSSSPSGIHFGHYIAGTYDPLVAEVDYLMALYPYETGYSPRRWQVGLNCMIEKKNRQFCGERTTGDPFV